MRLTSTEAANDAAGRPVIIEAALNGETQPSENPNVPVGPDAIAADAIACLDAGAAIIHVHNGNLRLWGAEAAQIYAQIARPMLAARPDALWYPTGSAAPKPELMYSHLGPLAELVPVQFGALDPGATNMGWPDDEGLPVGPTIAHTYEVIRYRASELERLGLGAALGIYEPGYLRTTLALHRAGRLPRGSMVKLYFGQGAWFHFGMEPAVSFGLPPTENTLRAYLDMLEGTDLEWCVSVVGGDVLRSPVGRLALELGGHLHVGLEFFYAPGRTPTNVELVEEAVALSESVGRPVASTSEAAAMLDLPRQPTAV